jgi:hypothetical protein
MDGREVGMQLGAQLIPLLGVVVGVLTSYLLTARQDRRLYHRQITDRWDSNELEAYAQYTSAVGITARRAGQVAGCRDFDSYAARFESGAALERLDAAEEQRTMAFERVALLGDTEVVTAAQRLNQAVWNLEWYARGEPDPSPSGWAELLDEYVGALGRFHDAARRALTVSGSVRVDALGDRLPHLQYEARLIGQPPAR